MLVIKLPNLETIQQIATDVKLENYHLYSSIFEKTPKLSFSFTAAYATPDIMQLNIGSSFPLQYQFESTRSIKSQDEDGNEEIINSSETTNPEDFAGMVVSNVTAENSPIGTKITVGCTGEFDFFQNSNIRKAYTNSYGNTIIQDILDSNNTMKGYQRDIQNTDNAATVYRSLGDSDLDFIESRIYKNYTINNGQPLLFTSLDRVVHFTSATNLLESNKKSKLVIKFKGLTNDSLSEAFVNGVLENYVDKDYAEVTASEYKLKVGSGDTAFNLRNATYYTDFSFAVTSTTGYVFKPALKGKQFFPIDKFFTTFSKATQAVGVYNRPSNNIVYESRDYFDSFEKLITIKVKIAEITRLQSLVVAGDLATVVTTYPYSVYNGNYLIAEIEYGRDNQNTFMELTLIRPTLDFNWQENLTKNKESDDFKFTYAPTIQKSSLYSI